MRAIVLEKIGGPLKLENLPIPKPGKGEILIEVKACGICRTDLHILDGELPKPKLPLVLGHQVVGVVKQVGEGVHLRKVGERVGVLWLGESCGRCSFCHSKRENLCVDAEFTGYQKNGGYAEFCVADERFCFPLPASYSDIQAAPLLCAGILGYRALRFTGEAKRLGFYGFGSSAHLLIQVARAQGREVYVFTRRGDLEAQKFAREKGAAWAGDSETLPPKLLDAAILFAPVGSLVPQSLRALDKGGVVVCADIHMSDIPSFPYKLLWEERSIKSVANLTRQDAEEFLQIAAKIPLEVKVNSYPLERANEALRDLKEGKVTGSVVLTVK